MKLNVPLLNRIHNPFKKRKRDTSGDYMNPLRDWTIGLTVAVIFFVGGVSAIIFDFYTQFGVNIGADDGNKKNIPVYSTSEVRTFARQYAEKSDEFEKLRKKSASAVSLKQPFATTTESTPVSTEEPELNQSEQVESVSAVEIQQ